MGGENNFLQDLAGTRGFIILQSTGAENVRQTDSRNKNSCAMHDGEPPTVSCKECDRTPKAMNSSEAKLAEVSG
jgi:hypothetical protein